MGMLSSVHFCELLCKKVSCSLIHKQKCILSKTTDFFSAYRVSGYVLHIHGLTESWRLRSLFKDEALGNPVSEWVPALLCLTWGWLCKEVGPWDQHRDCSFLISRGLSVQYMVALVSEFSCLCVVHHHESVGLCLFPTLEAFQPLFLQIHFQPLPVSPLWDPIYCPTDLWDTTHFFP